MSKILSPYTNSGYALLLYIPLMVAGFYVTYFTVIFSPKPAMMHIHFGLMLVWMAMVIAQPFLIKNKKTGWHRAVGKASYVVVPLVLLSAWILLQYGYNNYVGNLASQLINGEPKFSREQIIHEGAIYILIALVYMVWLGAFYLMAIVHRKKAAAHTRYMIAASLTLTGPIIDRIFFASLGVTRVMGIPAESISFLIIDLVLTFLLIYDLRKGNSTRPLITALTVYLLGQLFYFLAQDSTGWDVISSFMMQPEI
jgi:hypothetical protein